MQTRIFHLQALSALHVGTGQGVGIVDLPIARAKRQIYRLLQAQHSKVYYVMKLKRNYL